MADFAIEDFNGIFNGDVLKAALNIDRVPPEELFAHVEDVNLRERLVENACANEDRFDMRANAELTEEFIMYMEQPDMKYREVENEDLRVRLINTARNHGGQINWETEEALRQEFDDYNDMECRERLCQMFDDEDIQNRMRVWQEERHANGDEDSEMPPDLRRDIDNWEYTRRVAKLPKFPFKASYESKIKALGAQCKRWNILPLQNLIQSFAIIPFAFELNEEKCHWENSHSFDIGSTHELLLKAKCFECNFLLVCGEFRFELKMFMHVDANALQVKMGSFFFAEIDELDWKDRIEPQVIDLDTAVHRVWFEILPNRQRFCVNYGEREQALEFNHDLKDPSYHVWIYPKLNLTYQDGVLCAN